MCKEALCHQSTHLSSSPCWKESHSSLGVTECVLPALVQNQKLMMQQLQMDTLPHRTGLTWFIRATELTFQLQSYYSLERLDFEGGGRKESGTELCFDLLVEKRSGLPAKTLACCVEMISSGREFPGSREDYVKLMTSLLFSGSHQSQLLPFCLALSLVC